MAEKKESEKRRSLDPILTLYASKSAQRSSPTALGASTASSSSIVSLCFLPDSSPDSSVSDSDDDGGFDLQCSKLLRGEKRDDSDPTASARAAMASLSLSGMRLVSSHTNGDCLLWELRGARTATEIIPNRGPGLALRRMGTGMFHHTRDDRGTVSLHDCETFQTTYHIESGSKTFCAAAPCTRNPYLLVAPTADRSVVSIYDIRVKRPVIVMDGATGTRDQQDFDSDKYGMVSSLAMSETGSLGRPILACGFESGDLFFHELAMLGRSPPAVVHSGTTQSGAGSYNEPHDESPCNISLAKDPILALDLVPSELPPTRDASGAVIAAAGMAGDAAELKDLQESERGTVAIVKVVEQEHTLSARLRSRIPTSERGKVGVALCRFRPDGRILAVGGWDKRLRLFDRRGAPLAILKGHTDSVRAMDWAPDAVTSGFLATGANDGQIHIWRCFSSD